MMMEILDLAHKLDLARCYTPEELTACFAHAKELSLDTVASKQSFTAMLRYATELMKAHGNALTTDLNADGEFVETHKSYAQPFEEVSMSIKTLQSVTNTVRYPEIKELYQFTQYPPAAVLSGG